MDFQKDVTQQILELQREVDRLKTRDSIGEYTLSSAADVSGPAGTGLLLLVRDNSNGGTALILYNDAGTPVIVAQSGTTAFVTAAPGATEIQVKNKAGNAGVDFRAGSSRNGVVLNVLTWVVDRN